MIQPVFTLIAFNLLFYYIFKCYLIRNPQKNPYRRRFVNNKNNDFIFVLKIIF